MYLVAGGKLKGEVLQKNELFISRHSTQALEKTVILLEKHWSCENSAGPPDYGKLSYKLWCLTKISNLGKAVTSYV